MKYFVAAFLLIVAVAQLSS
uniref:Uncharacterized protein n=1 Tax=Anopheles epiroticus TaxID=199890 RepID=A0A182PX83_9DIPT